MTQSQFRQVLTANDWPAPPRWLTTLHYACHSLPMALTGRWPGRELAAWTLHLVDIPPHSREPWEPRFLWVDGLV